MRLPVAPICLLFVIASLAQLIAQRPPAFDVVSVKRYQPDARGRVDDAISIFPGGRLSAPGATLQGLITTAYGLLDIQVVDSGRMLGFARYQIEGRTNPDVTLAEARAMLRTLLTERFALITHRETREMPVYVMTLDRKPGAQLRPQAANVLCPRVRPEYRRRPRRLAAQPSGGSSASTATPRGVLRFSSTARLARTGRSGKRR